MRYNRASDIAPSCCDFFERRFPSLFLIKVRTRFSAALRLYSNEMTEEENFRLYGKCASPNGHGHDYDVEVAFMGDIDSRTGMVANFYELQKLLDSEIFDRVDHTNLNTDVDFLKGVIPTTENLAKAFWDLLEPHREVGQLFSISVGERTNNLVTYFGPDANLNDIRTKLLRESATPNQ